VIGIMLDVTHIREAQETRRESEERYTKLFQTMSQAVVYLDGEGVLLAANPAAESLFGSTIDEMLGRHCSDLWWKATKEDGTPISPNEFPSMFALRTGSELHDLVLRIWNARTHEPRWVSTDVIPWFKTGEIKPRQVCVICRDITARVEAAARLRTSEERSCLLIQHGMEVIGVIDAAATITFVSPSVEKVFGYPPDLPIGTNALEYVHPDDRPALQKSIARILHSPPSAEVTLHVRLQHRAGGWRSVEAVATNCLDVEGLRGIVANIRDVTQRIEYEQQLRQLAAHIETDREQERIRVAHIIHDELGQMLSMLKLDLDALPLKFRPEGVVAQKAFARRIAAMRRQIEGSISTVRRIAAELRPGALDHLGLTAALSWQIDEFASRTGIRCRSRGLAHDLYLPAAQATAVFRIFQEILTNILRHAGASAITLNLRRKSTWFTLEVADDGKGITPAHLSDPHSLGLFGMRERAFLFGGEVRFSPRPGGGTVVTLSMPRGS
jgi:PAS domain S-box-containing protein